MTRAILILMFLATSVLGDAFYFRSDQSAKFKGKRVFNTSVGDSVHRGLYQFEVTATQYVQGFNQLPAGFAQSKIDAIDAAVQAGKPQGMKDAQNYMMKFLEDEGYIPPGSTEVTGDVESVVFKTLADDINANPNGPSVDKASKFIYLRAYLLRNGGTVNGSVVNP